MKLKVIKNIILSLTLIVYLYIALSLKNRMYYDIAEIRSIVIMLSLSLMVFAYGLIEKSDKEFKNNINCYILIYFVLLFSITMCINRSNIKISFENLKNINIYNNLRPFRSIHRFITHNVSTKTKVLNIIGNSVMLVPLSFLLILKNDKYKKIINQIKIILPVTIFIELLQVLISVGSFDIDDIILNFIGCIVFVIFIRMFNMVDKIKRLFYKDFKLNIYFKYTLFYISIIIPILFIIDAVITLTIKR